MTDITTMLQAALEDEPPIGIEPADVVRRGRASSRRSRVVAGAATSAGVLGVAAVAATVVNASSSPSHRAPHHSVSLGQLSAASGQQAAKPRRHLKVKASEVGGGVTSGNLAGLVEQSTGVGLVDTDVSATTPDGALNLGAGLDLTGDPYINVQLIPASEVSPAADTCADLNDLSSPDSDGYTGSCTLQHLADGSVLILRSGQTTTGGYTKVQADLLLADGAGIFAEDTNQTTVTAGLGGSTTVAKADHKRAVGAVISDQPPLDTTVMSQLVQDLAAASS